MNIRRIIDGKAYDTGTAIEVAEIADFGNGPNDFRFESTSLYRTQKGAWFIAGEGGALTRWARKVTDGYSSGHGLELVTADEARELLEHVDGPVEDYFEVEEG